MLFRSLKKALTQPGTPELAIKSGGLGLGWARAGGENQALAEHNLLAVDGIHNVSEVLEEIELGKLSDVDYLEAALDEASPIRYTTLSSLSSRSVSRFSPVLPFILSAEEYIFLNCFSSIP